MNHDNIFILEKVKAQTNQPERSCSIRAQVDYQDGLEIKPRTVDRQLNQKSETEKQHEIFIPDRDRQSGDIRPDIIPQENGIIGAARRFKLAVEYISRFHNSIVYP